MPGFFLFLLPMRTPQSWDVFCRVVDNFGDAAVCWRLARQLAQEHRGRVRLFIDDLSRLQALVPEIVERQRQEIAGVEVRCFDDAALDITPADVMIEAFGCGVPEAYLCRTAQSAANTIWIVLEYLSAESWVASHHGLPSPHPRFPIERYFVFPGFVAGTAGLLREQDLFAKRDAFRAADRAAFWRSLGHHTENESATTVSVFAYSNAPLGDWLRAVEHGPHSTVVVVPAAETGSAALSYFGLGSVPAERVVRRGSLEVRFIPFLEQDRYDALLWSCDINFVRGEDSFIRAQWAARPFVWNIYPQQDGAHSRKLQAFLELYCAQLPPAEGRVAADMMQAWNQTGGSEVSIRSAWGAFHEHHLNLRRFGTAWCDWIAKPGTLTANLAAFCAAKLK